MPLSQDLENASVATCKEKKKKYVKATEDQHMETKKAGEQLIEDINKK